MTKRAPGDQEGAKWSRERQVTRKALMARRPQSDRKGAECYEEPNGKRRTLTRKTLIARRVLSG